MFNRNLWSKSVIRSSSVISSQIGVMSDQLRVSLYIRLGYCFTLYQRLWLYNGAPLVAFYDTLGIRRTYSRLGPPASSRGVTVYGHVPECHVTFGRGILHNV